MKKILDSLRTRSTKNVLIIGDVMLDEYIFGSVNRISPEAPVPVVKEERREWYLGGAANVAANCKNIGFNVHLLGVVNADDAPGQKLRSLLSDINISVDGLVHVSRATTCKRRVMAGNHQCLRIDSEHDKPLPEKERGELIKNFELLVKQQPIVLISDYAKGVLDEQLIAYVVAKSREYGCIVMADPKGPHFNKYKMVTYLKPNLAAFNQMVDFYGLSHDNSMPKNGREICRILGLEGLIVTMGEKGIRFISEDKDIFSPSCKREVFDLSGAGDTVFSFLALALSNGLTLPDALKLANRAASVAISHLKTYAVSLEELIDKECETSEKIFDDWARLKIELDWQRADGKNVVFTNGCFDILHSGHIHTLKEAKRLGDILVVALNTDNSVKRLDKGSGRPINNLAERAIIMAAIGVVDFVTSFDQDTPQELIEYLLPNVLVKGGDYEIKEIVGYDCVVARGGEVHAIDFVPGRSTTSVINAMKKVVSEKSL